MYVYLNDLDTCMTLFDDGVEKDYHRSHIAKSTKMVVKLKTIYDR